MMAKIISGGQTGVDRAALDAALELGMSCGGWCPRGRLAEDGPIAARYPLAETPASGYAQRTEWNVRDSDGTLVLTCGHPTSGTAMTIEIAARFGKPCLVVDLAGHPSVETIRRWMAAQHVNVVNVAGPRESTSPGIYAQTIVVLRKILSASTEGGTP